MAEVARQRHSKELHSSLRRTEDRTARTLPISNEMVRDVLLKDFRDTELFEDDAFISMLTQRANEHGLPIELLVDALRDLDKQVTLEAETEALQDHDQSLQGARRDTAAAISNFKSREIRAGFGHAIGALTTLAVAGWKEAARDVGLGLASDIRKNKVATRKQTTYMKQAMESVLARAINKNRLETYLRAGGPGLRSIVERFQKGKLTLTEFTVSPDLLEGIDSLINATDIDTLQEYVVEAGPPAEVIDFSKFADQEAEGIKKAIKGHWRFLLRDQIVTLATERSQAIVSSDDYEPDVPGKMGTAKSIVRRAALSGTLWTVGLRVGGKLAIGGALGATVLTGGTGIAIAAGLGVVTGAVRAYINAEKRARRTRVDASIGTKEYTTEIDGETYAIVESATEIEKKLKAAIQEATRHQQEVSKTWAAFQRSKQEAELLRSRGQVPVPDNTGNEYMRAREGMQKTMLGLYSILSDAHTRLARSRSATKNRQDFISFGYHDRAQAITDFASKLEAGLAVVNTYVESLEPGLPANMMVMEMHKIDDKHAGLLDTLEAGLSEEVNRDRGKKIIKGALYGGAVAGAVSFAMDGLFGGDPNSPADIEPLEPTPIGATIPLNSEIQATLTDGGILVDTVENSGITSSTIALPENIELGKVAFVPNPDGSQINIVEAATGKSLHYINVELEQVTPEDMVVDDPQWLVNLTPDSSPRFTINGIEYVAAIREDSGIIEIYKQLPENKFEYLFRTQSIYPEQVLDDPEKFTGINKLLLEVSSDDPTHVNIFSAINGQPVASFNITEQVPEPSQALPPVEAAPAAPAEAPPATAAPAPEQPTQPAVQPPVEQPAAEAPEEPAPAEIPAAPATPLPDAPAPTGEASTPAPASSAPSGVEQPTQLPPATPRELEQPTKLPPIRPQELEKPTELPGTTQPSGEGATGQVAPEIPTRSKVVEQAFAQTDTKAALEAIGVKADAVTVDDAGFHVSVEGNPYLSATEGWRQVRLELLLEAKRQGLINPAEKPVEVLSRIEQATNLALNEKGPRLDQATALQRAFGMDIKAVRSGVMPYVTGEKGAGVDARWEAIVEKVAQLPEQVAIAEPAAGGDIPGVDLDSATGKLEQVNPIELSPNERAMGASLLEYLPISSAHAEPLPGGLEYNNLTVTPIDLQSVLRPVGERYIDAGLNSGGGDFVTTQVASTILEQATSPDKLAKVKPERTLGLDPHTELPDESEIEYGKVDIDEPSFGDPVQVMLAFQEYENLQSIERDIEFLEEDISQTVRQIMAQREPIDVDRNDRDSERHLRSRYTRVFQAMERIRGGSRIPDSTRIPGVNITIGEVEQAAANRIMVAGAHFGYAILRRSERFSTNIQRRVNELSIEASNVLTDASINDTKRLNKLRSLRIDLEAYEPLLRLVANDLELIYEDPSPVVTVDFEAVSLGKYSDADQAYGTASRYIDKKITDVEAVLRAQGSSTGIPLPAPPLPASATVGGPRPAPPSPFRPLSPTSAPPTILPAPAPVATPQPTPAPVAVPAPATKVPVGPAPVSRPPEAAPATPAPVEAAPADPAVEQARLLERALYDVETMFTKPFRDALQKAMETTNVDNAKQQEICAYALSEARATVTKLLGPADVTGRRLNYLLGLRNIDDVVIQQAIEGAIEDIVKLKPPFLVERDLLVEDSIGNLSDEVRRVLGEEFSDTLTNSILEQVPLGVDQEVIETHNVKALLNFASRWAELRRSKDPAIKAVMDLTGSELLAAFGWHNGVDTLNLEAITKTARRAFDGLSPVFEIVALAATSEAGPATEAGSDTAADLETPEVIAKREYEAMLQEFDGPEGRIAKLTALREAAAANELKATGDQTPEEHEAARQVGFALKQAFIEAEDRVKHYQGLPAEIKNANIGDKKKTIKTEAQKYWTQLHKKNSGELDMLHSTIEAWSVTRVEQFGRELQTVLAAADVDVTERIALVVRTDGKLRTMYNQLGQDVELLTRNPRSGIPSLEARAKALQVHVELAKATSDIAPKWEGQMRAVQAAFGSDDVGRNFLQGFATQIASGSPAEQFRVYGRLLDKKTRTQTPEVALKNLKLVDDTGALNLEGIGDFLQAAVGERSPEEVALDKLQKTVVTRFGGYMGDRLQDAMVGVPTERQTQLLTTLVGAVEDSYQAARTAHRTMLQGEPHNLRGTALEGAMRNRESINAIRQAVLGPLHLALSDGPARLNMDIVVERLLADTPAEGLFVDLIDIEKESRDIGARLDTVRVQFGPRMAQFVNEALYPLPLPEQRKLLDVLLESVHDDYERLLAEHSGNAEEARNIMMRDRNLTNERNLPIQENLVIVVDRLVAGTTGAELYAGLTIETRSADPARVERNLRGRYKLVEVRLGTNMRDGLADDLQDIEPNEQLRLLNVLLDSTRDQFDALVAEHKGNERAARMALLQALHLATDRGVIPDNMQEVANRLRAGITGAALYEGLTVEAKVDPAKLERQLNKRLRIVEVRFGMRMSRGLAGDLAPLPLQDQIGFLNTLLDSVREQFDALVEANGGDERVARDMLMRELKLTNDRDKPISENMKIVSERLRAGTTGTDLYTGLTIGERAPDPARLERDLRSRFRLVEVRLGSNMREGLADDFIDLELATQVELLNVLLDSTRERFETLVSAHSSNEQQARASLLQELSLATDHGQLLPDNMQEVANRLRAGKKGTELYEGLVAEERRDPALLERDRDRRLRIVEVRFGPRMRRGLGAFLESEPMERQVLLLNTLLDSTREQFDALVETNGGDERVARDTLMRELHLANERGNPISENMQAVGERLRAGVTGAELYAGLSIEKPQDEGQLEQDRERLFKVVAWRFGGRMRDILRDGMAAEPMARQVELTTVLLDAVRERFAKTEQEQAGSGNKVEREHSQAARDIMMRELYLTNVNDKPINQNMEEVVRRLRSGITGEALFDGLVAGGGPRSGGDPGGSARNAPDRRVDHRPADPKRDARASRRESHVLTGDDYTAVGARLDYMIADMQKNPQYGYLVAERIADRAVLDSLHKALNLGGGLLWEVLRPLHEALVTFSETQAALVSRFHLDLPANISELANEMRRSTVSADRLRMILISFENRGGSGPAPSGGDSGGPDDSPAPTTSAPAPATPDRAVTSGAAPVPAAEAPVAAPAEASIEASPIAPGVLTIESSGLEIPKLNRVEEIAQDVYAALQALDIYSERVQITRDRFPATIEENQELIRGLWTNFTDQISQVLTVDPAEPVSDYAARIRGSIEDVLRMAGPIQSQHEEFAGALRRKAQAIDDAFRGMDETTDQMRRSAFMLEEAVEELGQFLRVVQDHVTEIEDMLAHTASAEAPGVTAAGESVGPIAVDLPPAPGTIGSGKTEAVVDKKQPVVPPTEITMLNRYLPELADFDSATQTLTLEGGDTIDMRVGDFTCAVTVVESIRNHEITFTYPENNFLTINISKNPKQKADIRSRVGLRERKVTTEQGATPPIVDAILDFVNEMNKHYHPNQSETSPVTEDVDGEALDSTELEAQREPRLMRFQKLFGQASREDLEALVNGLEDRDQDRNMANAVIMVVLENVERDLEALGGAFSFTTQSARRQALNLGAGKKIDSEKLLELVNAAMRELVPTDFVEAEEDGDFGDDEPGDEAPPASTPPVTPAPEPAAPEVRPAEAKAQAAPQPEPSAVEAPPREAAPHTPEPESAESLRLRGITDGVVAYNLLSDIDRAGRPVAAETRAIVLERAIAGFRDLPGNNMVVVEDIITRAVAERTVPNLQAIVDRELPEKGGKGDIISDLARNDFRLAEMKLRCRELVGLDTKVMRQVLQDRERSGSASSVFGAQWSPEVQAVVGKATEGLRRGITLYEVLGVGRDATGEDIKKAFRQKAKDSHPDTHPGDPVAEAQFKRVTAAWDILGDDTKRSNYDAGMRSSGGRFGGLSLDELFGPRPGSGSGGGDSFVDIFGTKDSSGSRGRGGSGNSGGRP